MNGDTLGPVPVPLIPFFKAGGLRIILETASQVGTGLNFINSLRKRFPKDPRVTNQEYMGWLSYLSKTAKFGLQMGATVNDLSPLEGINPELIPRNYFLRYKEGGPDRYNVLVRYQSLNPESGQVYQQQANLWFDELGTKQSLLDKIKRYVQNVLNLMSTSAGKAIRYILADATIQIVSILKRY